MIDTFTHETFAGRVGEPFRIHLDDGSSIETRLASARTWGGEQSRGRTPFTLTFHGPLSPTLPQRIYRMEHDGIGTFELFLVPVGPEGGAMQYEAVFS
jgi:hypothetical protein